MGTGNEPPRLHLDTEADEEGHHRGTVERETQGVFGAALAVLPPSLSASAWRRLEARGRLSPNCTSWGSIGFELVCETLRAPSARFEFLRRLWNLLYGYSIFLDDAIDAVEDHPVEIITCDLILDALHFEFFRIADSDGRLVASFERYRRQSIASMTAEFSSNSVICTLSEKSAELILGRKAAMIKFFADVVSHYLSGRVCTRSEYGRFDALCSAVQIVDDLTDIDEDALTNRTNSISAYVYQNFPGIGSLDNEYRAHAIRAALVVSGRYEFMLKRAEEHFQRFRDPDRGSGTLTDGLVSATLEDCRQTRRAIAGWRDNHQEHVRFVREALSTQGDPRAHQRRLLDAIVSLSLKMGSGVRAAN